MADMDTPSTTELRLGTGSGIITRRILNTPLRDALPSEIPIIDVADVYSEDVTKRKAVAEQVRAAAMNTGFFYAKNHGLSEDMIAHTYSTMLDFFHQDIDTKIKADSANTPDHIYGYRPPGSQILSRDEGVDVREAFFWHYDPPRTEESERTYPEYMKGRMTSDQFEDKFKDALVPDLRAALNDYSMHFTKLAHALTRTFALSLDLDEDYFHTAIQHPEVSLTANYYPPIAKPPTPSAASEVSIGSHTDFQFFTILSQDDVGGLQVITREGQWIRAPPIPGTVVVNNGDYMQRITNDKYISSVHRVHNWSGKERMSIPFFWGYALSEKLVVLENCVDEGEEKKYEDIGCQEWVEWRMKDMMALNAEA